ncbi:MAG: carboxypeptidase regulatory-like domain-containing protein [Pyrinomonadaceae bacterium]
MKKIIIVVAILFIGISFILGWGSIREVAAQVIDYFYTDADMGPFENAKRGMTKEEFMLKRADQIAMFRGVEKDKPFNPQLRIDAIRDMERQEEARAKIADSNFKTSILDLPWTEIGPNPIPNSQITIPPVTTASGRTISIAVHPTNPDIVYVGTAQGGLYRSTNGGTSWTRLMDSALSLAIGAIAIAPSQPDTIYVGTGEPNFSQDSFFGVGVYRIDNASTTANLSGPFGGASFNGRAIGEIAVHPTNPATIFVGSTSGVGGIGPTVPGGLPSRGIYRSTDATSGAPTFAKLTGLEGNGDFSIRDLILDPLNPDLLVCNLIANGGGIYVSTNATAANPTFTRRVTFVSGSVSELTAEFAIQHTAGPNPTIYAATGNLGGRVLINTDGGTTWTQQIDNNFCTPQCFYDIAIDVDPTNAANVFVGGSPTLIFGRSTNSGVTFTANAATAAGLHVDTHAIAVAPSLPTTIYFGSDGGIYKSTDSGSTWTSLNNSQFTATQFMGLDVHPTDPNFSIGGTQDNGTNFYQPAGTWTRADFGDGGYAVIDQNAPDTTNVTMYHTYFNQTNAMGYARVLTTANASDGLWQGYGCGFGGFIANGMTCAASAILFYAPMERGPGNPNTLYFGSDVLYRSANSGVTATKVSQEPIQATVPISAIGIAPSNDNVRIVGQSNGNLFGTTTGANPLVNMDPTNAIPNNFVARAVIHPTNSDIAYVTLSAFGVVNVWRTSTLSSLVDNIAPTWTAATGTGANVLPQVPVNAFLIDPIVPNLIYAGTDIGVYVSGDQGTNWFPMGTGLPRVAVFDMAMTSGRLVRIATHGRGMWQIPAAEPTAANVSISGRVVTANGFSIRNARVTLTGQNGFVRTAQTNSFGYYRLIDIPVGQTYVMDARAKSYSFAPRTLNVNDELTDIDLVASP